MSAFRGILTGYGIAAIKNKEAKDNAKMEVIKSAGIDFFENKVPQHEKEMKLYEKDFNAVALVHGEDIANLFGDADAGFYGTGKGLDLVNGVIKQKKIDKERLKNFKFSSQEDRISKKKSAFQKKSDQMKNLTGIGGMGPGTVENQLEGFGETETSDGTTIPAPVDMGTMEKEVEGTPDTTQDISTLFSDRPDVQGVESKYNNISKAVNEQMQYGSPIYNAADQTTTFNISDQFRSKSQAHIQIASEMTANDKTINQLDVVSRSKQELDNQTVIPFKVIAMSLGNNTEYREGHGKANAMLSGLQSRTIDSANTTVKRQIKNSETNKIEMQDTGVSIFEYLTDVYNNDLLKDGQSGKVNSLVFKKFLENIPPTIMYGDQSLKSVIAQAHESSFFKL
tara:strand:- start:381 stop:1565 length:1185 start_codon:yes stop_codon:yes gene_type:complete